MNQPPPDPHVAAYLTSQQCARQWRAFLAVVADEFSAELPEADLRALMRRIGTRFGRDTALPPCQTLADLEFAMSKAWVGMDWGWVSLVQQPAYLHISHHCSPLVAAFGPAAAAWSPAFLEGVYQQWFANAGSSGELKVTQLNPPDAWGAVEFRLGR